MTSKIKELTLEEFNSLIANTFKELIKSTLEKRIAVLEDKINLINEKIEDLNLFFIQEEDIGEEELKELEKLSIETKKNGISWKKLKAELNP
ncbi:MAG: hypothetical protein ACTSR3_18930 [Candidatus Helarchaeota archaeon]